MKKSATIVGAGLSGLVAAINLARRGYDVTVLEREERIGGSSLYHPSGQGTPLRIPEMKKYIGIDLGEVLKPIKRMHHIAGRKVADVDPAAISAMFFERGPRSSSVDSFLYEIAKNEGVEVKFNNPIISKEQVTELPPNTIICTGLHFEGFEMMNVPFLTSHHFTYKGSCDPDLNYVSLYHDSYTPDYGYTSAFNGVEYVHLFNRKRAITLEERARFAESIKEVDGIEVPSWSSFTFPVPAASVAQPRLLCAGKILAGTLAGAMDPIAFFGLHGALVSGKIAALAVEDKEFAWQEFKRASSFFKFAYLGKKSVDLQPNIIARNAMHVGVKVLHRMPHADRLFLIDMPGSRNVYSDVGKF